MTHKKRTLTTDQQSRVNKARAAAEGPDRNDLIRQARAAQAEARLDDVITALKAARESAGLSLREIETATGISRGNLSRLENGTGNPTVATLRRYATAIGKTVRITIE